ncbi:MAG: sulfatase-like hydrolase/transferase [Planctomycetota bacterium]
MIGTHAAAQAAAPLLPPNIVIFLADDMGLGDCAAYQDLTGNADQHQIRGPHVQLLADHGIRMTDAHSSSGVCTPSRISLLSGVYSFRSPLKQLVGFVGQDIDGSLLPGDRRTIPWMLQKHGYATLGFGKWHLGVQGQDVLSTGVVQEGPVQLGFDTYTGTPANFGDGAVIGFGAMLVDDRYLGFDSEWNLVSLDSPEAQQWTPEDNPEFIERIQQVNLDAMNTGLASHLSQNGQQPFFVYYASHGNHTPFVTGDEIAGVPLTTDVTVAGGAVPITVMPDDDQDGIPEPNDPLYTPQEDTHWDPYYVPPTRLGPGTNGPTERGTMIIENDVIVGEIMAFLSETDDPRVPGSKLIENTLFIFTSDNGADLDALPAVGGLPQASDDMIRPLRGRKATPWEGGSRVPFIAMWPNRIPEGVTSDALIGQVDLYATLAAIVGHELEPNEAVDSVNVLAALTAGATGAVRDTDLVYKQRQNLLIRRGGYKLRAVESDYVDTRDRFGDNLDFLDLSSNNFYDLDKDIDETQNLVNNPSLGSLIGEMLAVLQSYVSQGFSRTGAAAIQQSVNFLGGDFHTSENWHSYTEDVDEKIPGDQADATAFVVVDGTASVAVTGVRVVQRGGTFDFVSPNSWQSAVGAGATWFLEGGTMRDGNSAIRVDNGGSLVVDGGLLDVLTSGDLLRMSQGDGLIELGRGEIRAQALTFGTLGNATAGEKIMRFGRGDGTMTLGGSDPIRFGDDGDSANDRIDFLAGSQCRLVSTLTDTALAALWGSGRIRYEGQAAVELGQSLLDLFDVTDNGDGTTTLMLRQVCVVDRTGDSVPDAFDLVDLLGTLEIGTTSIDIDGSGVTDAADLKLFIVLLERGCKI